jgi:hypothetical protein
MLIDRGVTEGEVVTIKLTSGEELVAKLIEDGPVFVKLSRPRPPREVKACAKTSSSGMASNPTQIAALKSTATKSLRSTFGFLAPSKTCSRPKAPPESFVPTTKAIAVIKVWTNTNAEASSRSNRWVAAKKIAVSIVWT